ncbi:MAG: hypothetical protein ABIS67_15800 [Candidatus Eisenbacteria bacterium]
MLRSYLLTRRAVFVALVSLAVACSGVTVARSATATNASVLAKRAASTKPVTATKTAGGSATTAPGKSETPKRADPLKPAGEVEETLKGGQEGTVFRSLTVEGEDRIHYEVERPELRLELDPAKAPGLEWGTARDVLDRTTPDQMAPLLAGSARDASPYTGRPWLSHFASGAVARFRPAVEGVEHWKLTVANWRGETVTTFQGKGDPPREIAWDGRAANGAAVMPGRTYSYVFEATDRAGNRRNFVGEGFRVAAFRVTNETGTALVFTAGEMSERGLVPGMASGSASMASGANSAPPVILEAASWLNQTATPTTPIVVTATARSADEAATLAQRVQSQLGTLLIGDAVRVRTETRVESDAPPGGAVALVTGRAGAAVKRK